LSPNCGNTEVFVARHKGSLRIAVKDYGCAIVEQPQQLSLLSLLKPIPQTHASKATVGLV
jgi:hypothetical protein